MKKNFLLAIAFLAVLAQSAVNFPYPQEKSYENGIKVSTSGVSTTLKNKYTTWLSQYYVEGTCNGTPCARIKYDNADQTVSEGIGYGMLIMVYFADASNGNQAKFDKLWAYYNAWLNGNGLMHWKINGFSGVAGENAATDAEFDVALALAMAYYQFGDAKYQTAAQGLIQKIRTYEMEPGGLHKPGDAWNDRKNPSYVAPAAFEIFKSFDQSAFWSTAITANYTLLKNNANLQTTGLVSDWANSDGSLNESANFGYESARSPWRVMTDYAWFGRADASTILTKLATWVNSKNAADIKGAIQTNGTMGNDHNSTFVGGLTNALQYSSTYQSKLNSYFQELMTLSGEPYFSATLQLLTGLLATGNMPNFKALSESGSSSSSAGSSSSGAYTIIDDFEDEDGLANTLEPWYIYTDVNDKGASTVANAADDEGYETVQKDGSNWVAWVKNYSLSKGENKDDPYVALGLDTKNNPTNYDLSKCTDGFSYRYKGAAHSFVAEMTTVTDYAYHQNAATASAAWADMVVPLSGLLQPSWKKTAVDFDAKKIKAFTWQIKGGVATTTGSLEIDDFKCLGAMTLPPKPESSSSSAGSSSSSSSSSSVSSSSSIASSSSASGSSSSATVSSSSTMSSSSSVPAESGFYYITRFNEGEQTAYGDYPFAFVYGDPNKVTIENEKDGDDYIVAVGGEGILTNAKLVAEASYGAGAIGVKNNTSAGLKISDCTDGFSYKYKGAAHQFKLETDGNICGKSDNSNSFYKDQSASSSYKTVTVTPAQLATSAWKGSDCEGASLNLANVTQLAWELKYGVSGNANDVVSLSIDDVKCLGAGLSTDMVVTPSSSSAAGSSSSAKQSSSSAAKSSSSSAKSSSSNGSSSSGGTTPIISLNVIPSANSAFLLNNGLRMQVMQNATLDIYNLNGVKIRQFNFNSGEYSVSLADLPKGLYICNIQFNNSQRKVLNVPIR
ncbi:hypothetical protein AGMMS49938_06070 [Fibrobacterales bacterium]|nr:hypothetical protein AGMMS49938_06070 [Fibrobacterales bacterium]